ncbi:murein biosynthesis integral membrane protein MurJ [Curvibacter sp. APW13]|uniref:murein biosynthesis integral membrane protein MurJ n=1 Tax=Curvibacter sp. APW13 TaxID=3077236 RepID=UPI0028DDADB8|nr:murein biosynthesis integral membrane protein MurJ [Curvibacter sp. APW13]MDT8991059.1 murein biosynthesis integral membrane protein MurJ [Curvibacter sp. APW13]
MSLLKSASTVSLWTLLSRITGLARELLVASLFGASAMTDAFNVAFRIPNLFRRLFAEGAFSQAFVPVLAASKARDGEDLTRSLIDRVATVLAWALLLTCILGVLAAPWMVWAMASGLQKNPAGYDAAVWMTRFMFPYIGFMSMVALASGVLNTWKRFAVPAATPVLLNVSTILAAWLLSPVFAQQGIPPIYAMAVGVMVGGVLQLGLQIPALRGLGLLPKISLRWSGVRAAWRDSGTQQILRLMLPALLGVSVAQISLLINTQIASHLATGSVSWLSYADRLMEFPTAMLGVALGVVLMPQLAGARAKGESDKYSELLDWGLRLVLLLAVPCAVALLVFSKPLVSVLYHYGAFSDHDVQQTALAMMGWGAGLVGIVAIKVLAPGFYASQDIKTPVRIAMAVLVVTQLLNLLLVPKLQHAGLSLSIGLGAMVNALWLLVGLIRRGSYRPLPGWGRLALQVGASSAILVVYLLWAAGAWDWTGLRSQALLRMGLMAAILAGAAVLYLGSVWACGLNLRQFLRR